MKTKSILNALKKYGLKVEGPEGAMRAYRVHGEGFSLKWFDSQENVSCIYLEDMEDPGDSRIDHYTSTHWYTIKSAIEAYFNWNMRYFQRKEVLQQMNNENFDGVA